MAKDKSKSKKAKALNKKASIINKKIAIIISCVALAIIAAIVSIIIINNNKFDNEKRKYEELSQQFEAMQDEFNDKWMEWFVDLIVENVSDSTVVENMDADEMGNKCIDKLLDGRNYGDTTWRPKDNYEAYKERNEILKKKIDRQKDMMEHLDDCRDIVLEEVAKAEGIVAEAERKAAEEKAEAERRQAEYEAKIMTIEKFNNIKNGMTLSQIKAMFDFDHYCKVGAQSGSYTIYSCEGENYSTGYWVVSLSFNGNRLVSKAQSGL